MKRFHGHLHVEDLGKSIGVYGNLFAAEPMRVEGDRAKWMLEDPRINLASSTRGSHPGIDHLGFQTDDPAELAEMKARADSADIALLDEGETTCCDARSEKHWVTDPQGIACEHVHTLGHVPVFSEGRKGDAAAAWCTPAATAAPLNRDHSCPDPVQPQLGAKRAGRGHAQPPGRQARSGRAGVQCRQRSEPAHQPVRDRGARARRHRDEQPPRQDLGRVQRQRGTATGRSPRCWPRGSCCSASSPGLRWPRWWGC